MKAETIPVYLCCDENYVPQLCVVLMSATRNTQSKLHFIVLNFELSDFAKNNIKNAACANDVTFVSIAPYVKYFSDFPKKQSHISIAACYRYLIPILDFSYDKGIYLDCDVVGTGDLREIYDFDLGGCSIAGANDFHGRSYLKKLGVSHYFNSGILLMDIGKMRSNEATFKLIKKTIELKDNIKYLDQDVLNLFFAGDSKILPTRFGVVSSVFRKNVSSSSIPKAEIDRAIYNPIVVHFTGPDKPWVIPYGVVAHPWTPLYFSYLSKTAYAFLAGDILHNFSPIRCFFWYWKRHLGFFLRPQFYKMRTLYGKNSKKIL